MPFLSIVIAYLLGAIPFAYLVVRYVQGIDIRTVGSGNVGSTNALRTAGKAWGLLVLLLDAGKGFAAVVLARQWTGDENWALGAAVAVMLGHVFPVFLGFRGGKGVAAGFGAYLAISPLATGLAAVFFALAVSVTRFMSLGSILGSASFPVWALICGESGRVILAGAACAGLIVWKHSSNIQRLVNGTESRLAFGRK